MPKDTQTKQKIYFTLSDKYVRQTLSQQTLLQVAKSLGCETEEDLQKLFDEYFIFEVKLEGEYVDNVAIFSLTQGNNAAWNEKNIDFLVQLANETVGNEDQTPTLFVGFKLIVNKADKDGNATDGELADDDDISFANDDPANGFEKALNPQNQQQAIKFLNKKLHLLNTTISGNVIHQLVQYRITKPISENWYEFTFPIEKIII